MSSLDDCDDSEILADAIIYAQDCETVCYICNAEFLEPQDLEQHLTQIHSSELPNLVQCQFCTSSVPDLEKYAMHIRDYHLKALKMCNYCTKTFLDYDQYRKHEKRHHCSKKGFSSCSQCSELFSRNVELERHEYEHHNNEEDGFMLQDLFPILSSVLNRKAVLFIQSIKNNLPCQCLPCGYVASNLAKYVEHLQKENCKSFSCNNCSYTHKSKKILLRHLYNHKECFDSVSAEKKHKCTECHEYILSYFYQAHVEQCKPLKCLPCNKIFNSLELLSSHQCNSHPMAAEVKVCKFCSRQCVGEYSLRKHVVRVHKDDVYLYKYKCMVCEIPFKHPQKLFSHYFIKHKDLEPYTCKICDKKFRLRKRFTIHIKLDHKSVGFVEFDKNYHVFFTERRSVKPFIPHCVLSEKELHMYTEDSPHQMKKNEKEINLDLDLLNQTETEGNATEVDTRTKKKVVKRRRLIKRNRKIPEEEVIAIESTDDEDAPLVTLKKRKLIDKPSEPSLARKKSVKDNRQHFTCNICYKYCYTYQNFQHHMSLHSKSDVKTCIKCSQVFKSKVMLNKHIETAHSSSKLTETLKNLLEKRKQSLTTSVAMSAAERFQQTIKKSKTDTLNVATATLTPADNGISVRKFLETFTPENEHPNTPKRPNVCIENCVTIKKVTDPFYRKSTIQMSKFEKTESFDNPKLQLPVRFTQCNTEPVKCTVKIIQNEYIPTSTAEGYEYVDQGECIPDVAQEVMLEVSEEPQKHIDAISKVVLPNLPPGCDNISIAHLQPQAPYYKIVKMNDIIERKPEETRSELIRLPDGTQMITVNPLKHLLGGKEVDEILPYKKKYYKPKISNNVEDLLTKALEKANMPLNVRRKSAVRKYDEEISN